MSKTIAWAEGTFTNMTEPFTVMLTNEAQQFATDSNRKVTSAQSYYTDIIVIRGSQERTDYTIGNITSGSGITVSKSSKRVTFSVSAGTTIGADAGVIEIPITLDGQTVKKQFSWSCGKQGPQGAKGNPGTSITITSKSVTYQASSSGTTTPTGTWSNTVPTVNNGQYLWTKTTVQYSDGNKTEAYSVSYKGTNGTNGTSVTVSKTEVTYQVSTSGTTAPTGTWSTTMPSCDQGLYLWTKTYVKYSDGKDTTSYTVSYKGVDGNNFSWNLVKGTGTPKEFKPQANINNSCAGFYKLDLSDNLPSLGDKFTISCDIEWTQFTQGTGGTFSWGFQGSTDDSWTYGNPFMAALVGVQPSKDILLSSSGSKHLSASCTIGAALVGKKVFEIGVRFNYSDGTGMIKVSNLKIAKEDKESPWCLHPDELQGKGVKQEIIYYLATSASNGVTTSTSGWSTDPTTQKLTADKKYLWSCKRTEYDDGTTSDYTTPAIIGVYGDKGANALQCKRNWTGTYTTINGTGVATLSDFNRTPVAGDVFTALDGSSNTGTWQVTSVSGSNVYIKLLSYVNSKGDNAKNLSITPSSQYFKSTDGGKTFAPNTITIKPTIQGEISFGKWQYSIDGGVSFADVVSGQKGLTISNNVLSVSKDSSLYSDAVTMVTFRAVANDGNFYDTCSIAKIYDVSDIGDGRNLIQKTQLAPIDGPVLNLDDYTKNGTVIFDNKSANSGFSFDKYNNYQPNSKYVLSYYFTKTSGIMDHFGGFHNGKGVTYTSYFVDDKAYSGGSYSGESSQIGALLNDGKRHRIVVCYTTPSTIPADTNVSYTYIQPGHGNTNPNFGVKIEELKLEKGSSPTGWSPAPEDLQTAILSTKSEISSVSSKVDQNTKSIQNKVENTTYQNDLKLVKGDISKANEGLNKWRYEIYPKSLFASEYQGKSTMDVFAKNTNLTPSQSVLINDTNFGKNWAYENNYIGYALTFVKFSTAKSVTITFKHDDGAHLYLNGKLIGGSDGCNTGSGQTLELSFVKGWNCIEVVLNEITGGEYIGFGTTISTLSECELMNCYYAMVTGRESQITNTLVQNTIDIDGVSTRVGKVTSVIGEDGGKFTEFKNDYSNFKQSMDGFKTTVSSTYVTKNDFDDLEIGGRNLLLGTYKYTKSTPLEKTGLTKDDYKHYKDLITSIELEVGQQYVIQAQTDGTWAASHNTNGADPSKKLVTLWLCCDKKNACFDMRKGYAIFTPKYATKYWIRINQYSNDTDSYTVHVWDLKVEKGNKPTGWSPAPEDVNGKIVNVETIANQTAKKFEWIVKGGDSSSNFTLTDRVADLVAERINLNGLVTFSGLNTDAKNEIGKVAQSKVDGLEVGGRNLIINSNLSRTLTNVTNEGCSNMTVVSDSVYGHALKFTAVNQRRVFWATNNVWVEGKTYAVSFVAKSSVAGQKIRPSRSTGDWGEEITLTTSYARYTTKITSTGTNTGGTLSFSCPNAVGDIMITNVKLEVGNKATDWTPAPEDVSQDATNKASQALTDAKNYSSSAVNWVTNNGSSTTSLNSMVKKWTDGAVSDTAQINGGWIKASTITASKIAVSDFTNYCQLDKDSAPSYGFTATDDEDGIWYTADPIKRDKEISQWFACEDSQKLYVEYDISTTVQGKVNSSDTDNSYLHSGIMIFVADGNKKVISYIRTKDATAAADGIVTHVSVTETLPTRARFFKVVLQTNGQNGSFSGVLKIRNLQVRKATTGKLIVDGAITADKIDVSDLFAKNITASGTIQSKNYAESNGAATAGSKWILSDGSFKSKNLSWDASGNITAAGGKIGKYTITDSYLITGSGATASGFGGNQAFWAGSSSSNDAPFRVGYNGQLVASGATLTNAIVSGDITAIKGQIGELVLQDGTLTGSGQIIKNKTDSSGNITSTTTTDYITKISKEGLNIESTIMSSDSDTKTNRGIYVSPESIHLSYDGLISRLTPQGLNILGSDRGQVSINNIASILYYSDEGYKTRFGIDNQGILLRCEDGNKTFKINISGANGMDISGANVRLQNNITASRFVFYKDSFNYIESLEANNTNNIYFHSNGYYSFRVNNEGNWSDETQSVYITERGISVPGEIGLYSQEMSNYVARYYVAGSTKCTAIGNGSYATRIYGSSVWAQKAVSTSDVRLKQDFQPLDKFEDLYMQLQPVSFKYIDGYDKSEDRYFGLKAQPTEKLFEDMGENPDDYAMFNKFGIDHEDIKERIGHDVNFDEEHGLDYTNMIALNTHMVQKTRRELEQLERENAELKATLKAIIQKLNMQQN